MNNATHSISPVLRSLLDSNAGVADCFQTLVKFAIHQGAGDLHITNHRQGCTVGIRRDGLLQQLGEVDRDWGEHMVGYAKVEARLASAEHRRPQDGHLVIEGENQSIDLRISILPTAHGEDLAVRILYRREDLMNLDNLGLADDQVGWMRDIIQRPHGLVLVTGPTGSGKTTTLYALLKELNDGKRKINTIEDPVEYDLTGIHQSQVNPAIGLDFGDLLPSVLRQDPDVIMVGEVRDPKTATTVLRAAITGQLVLATMHATNTVGAIHAMLGLGAHPHLLGSALRAVIAQSLVRKICTNCARPLSQTSMLSTFDDIKRYLPNPQTPALYQGRGCNDCLQTGYRDRTGIFELLHVTPEIAALIESGASAPALQTQAVAQGMLTLADMGKINVARKLTTLEEVMRVIDLPTPGAASQVAGVSHRRQPEPALA